MATVSPGGDRLVVIDELPFRRNVSSVVRITDRISGETFSVPVAPAVRQGLSDPHWSPDGGRLLFTTRDYGLGADSPFTAGFVIVDVATRRTSIVRTFASDGDEDAGDGFYQWGPDGASVATISQQELKLLDLSGRPIRVVPRVGEAAAFDAFSPSRKSFVTKCDAGEMTVLPCVWHLGSGKRLAVVPVTRESEGRDYTVVGWYDDDHLIVGRPEGRDYTVFVQDLSGRQVKVLARISLRSPEHEVRVFYSRR